jgi:hypothetical protein
MLWTTHRRLTKEICIKLRLSNSSIEAKNLIDGVLAPDKWKDYPHHYGRIKSIQQYLLESRRLFLNDEILKGYYHLGIAFHYIQDAYTSFVWHDIFASSCIRRDLPLML